MKQHWFCEGDNILIEVTITENGLAGKMEELMLRHFLTRIADETVLEVTPNE